MRNFRKTYGKFAALTFLAFFSDSCGGMFQFAKTESVSVAPAAPIISDESSLAWTALKAGKLTEVQTAIKDALRLGTNDAKIFYHAGMIEKSSGHNNAAKIFLNKCLQINPNFDQLQTEKLKVALNELNR